MKLREFDIRSGAFRAFSINNKFMPNYLLWWSFCHLMKNPCWHQSKIQPFYTGQLTQNISNG